nr:MAG TPA: hypothetical protein [Inoviridae sp.]
MLIQYCTFPCSLSFLSYLVLGGIQFCNRMVTIQL